MNQAGYRKVIALLFFLLIVFSVGALCIGRYSYNPQDVIKVILSRLGLITQGSESMEIVLFAIRIPRIIGAILIGGMLSLSGAVYQGMFRNLLVSPDILGVSSGASVGAAVAILLGLGLPQRQLLAFAGGLLAVLLTTLIPKLMKNTSNLILVLSGIIVGGFLSSFLSLLKFIAEEQTELSSIVFWQMGSLANLHSVDSFSIGPVFVIGSILLVGLSWRINILSLGDIEARTLGMNVKQIRGIMIALATLLTASAVSICGTIGWIGLVIPHLGRLLVGSDHTKLLPTTILLGGLFLLTIDTIARTSISVEIPLTILTGFVGASFYAWLLYRQKVLVK